ncbi:MAG TPA: nuclear transport factor 2 family protein [Burkholderiaceae bacterium]|nr:nuclear transport factor 2 family protein [Burkholderiaceae bacterium]
MRGTRLFLAIFLSLNLSSVAFSQPIPGAAPVAELKRQVVQTETAFAKSMADRNFSAFTGFLSDEAVFFSATKVLHGKEEIASAWKPLFEASAAPFSWASGQVEVLNSGTLALSTGPVYGATGKVVGSFTSIWRLDAPGVWHIVFDKGNEACNCSEK